MGWAPPIPWPIAAAAYPELKVRTFASADQKKRITRDNFAEAEQG